jgi:hypothetical protein
MPRAGCAGRIRSSRQVSRAGFPVLGRWLSGEAGKGLRGRSKQGSAGWMMVSCVSSMCAISHEERAAGKPRLPSLAGPLSRRATEPDSPEKSGWRVTSDEGASIRTSGSRSSRLHRWLCNDWTCGTCNRLPQRDCSGFSPDSMTPSWLVGGKLCIHPGGDKAILGLPG